MIISIASTNKAKAKILNHSIIVYRFPKPLDPEMKGSEIEEAKETWSDTLEVECAWGKEFKEVGYEEREASPDYKAPVDIVPGCVDPRGCP